MYLIKTEDGFLRSAAFEGGVVAFPRIEDAELGLRKSEVPGTIATSLRNLIAHVDPEDPIRPEGRRPGTTRSPYSCDFEIDDEALEADLKELRELLNHPANER